MLLSWEPVPGDVRAYRVYRGDTPAVQVDPADYLTYVPARQTSFRDSHAGGGSWWYTVTTVSATGVASAPAEPIPPLLERPY